MNNRLTQIQHGNMVNQVLDPFYDVAYGYDPVGNRLYKQDFEEQSRSEVYTYDQRHRLTGFGRGTIQFSGGVASIATPISDPQMPSYQNWMPTGTTGLDSRGNWRNFRSTIASQTTTQTRTLDESSGGGGHANEYDRIDIPAGNMGHSAQQLTYDEAGNLVATDLLGDMNCDGVVNTSDRLPFRLAVNNPTSYASTYPDCMLELGDLNADGLVNTTDLNLFSNLVSNTLLAARRYEYDEENRLTAVTDIDGTALLAIEYDALGRRIATVDYAAALDPCTGAAPATGVDVQTRHIYSGLNTVAEYVWCADDWTVAREFLWGDSFPEPLVMIDFTDAGDVAAGSAEVLHYVRDALGSVVGLVDTGNPSATPTVLPKMVERYDYDPYGKTYIDTWVDGSGGASGSWARTPTSAYGNPFAWTAQRYDASVGMYHFAFRSYSPELGRWMQRDPLGYVNGVNLFAYAGVRPLYFCDPLGLVSELTIYVKRGNLGSSTGEMGHAFIGVTGPGDWPDKTKGNGTGKYPLNGAGREAILGFDYPATFPDDVNDGAPFDYSRSFVIDDSDATAARAAIAQAKQDNADWSVSANCVDHVLAVADAADVMVDRTGMVHNTPEDLEDALKRDAVGSVKGGPDNPDNDDALRPRKFRLPPDPVLNRPPHRDPSLWLKMLLKAYRDARQAYMDWWWWLEVGQWLHGPTAFAQSVSKTEWDLWWELLRTLDMVRRHIPNQPIKPTPCPHEL